jgi:hypothetical protein
VKRIFRREGGVCSEQGSDPGFYYYRLQGIWNGRNKKKEIKKRMEQPEERCALNEQSRVERSLVVDGGRGVAVGRDGCGWWLGGRVGGEARSGSRWVERCRYGRTGGGGTGEEKESYKATRQRQQRRV